MAKPKLALIPASQGSKVFSVLPSDGSGDFDFSRSGKATRINSQGLIEEVSNGQSRLNYSMIDGKVVGCPHHILEPSKQNALQRSEEFDNSYWINNGVTITANQIISPSGDLSADLLTGVSGGFGVVRFSTWTSTNKVASCFAKKGSSNLFKIANASSGVGGVTFNVESGIITNTASGFEGTMEDYGNGWYRCTAIDTSARSGTFSLGVTAASESVYIWGAQLESDYKTSYIPTTTTAVTRSAETANGAGNADTFNDSEGVLMAEISALANDGTNRRMAISDGDNTDRISIGFTSLNRIQFIIQSNNNIQVNTSITVPKITENTKVSFKYKANDCAFWIDGFELGTDTIATMPSGLNVFSFDEGNGGSNFYGKTKQIQYFNTALTDSELEELTSWESFIKMANGQNYTIK